MKRTVLILLLMAIPCAAVLANDAGGIVVIDVKVADHLDVPCIAVVPGGAAAGQVDRTAETYLRRIIEDEEVRSSPSLGLVVALTEVLQALLALLLAPREQVYARHVSRSSGAPGRRP